MTCVNNVVVNRTVRFGSNLVAELFGSVRPIFSDFYLIVRFGLPNSSAKFWPNSSVRFGSAKFEIGKVRFGSVRRKNSEFGSPLFQSTNINEDFDISYQQLGILPKI